MQSGMAFNNTCTKSTELVLDHQVYIYSMQCDHYIYAVGNVWHIIHCHGVRRELLGAAQTTPIVFASRCIEGQS